MDRNTSDSAGTIVFHEGKVLLIHFFSKYGFPKGHAEEGETLQETALRETEEETGLQVKITSIQDFQVASGKPGDHRLVHYFLAEKTGGTEKPQVGEVNEVLWKSPEEALLLLSFPMDREILSEILQQQGT